MPSARIPNPNRSPAIKNGASELPGSKGPEEEGGAPDDRAEDEQRACYSVLPPDATDVVRQVQ